MCHDVLMMSVNLRYIAISNTNNADYHLIINGINKDEAIKEKSTTLTHLKMGEEILTLGNVEIEKTNFTAN